MTFWRRNPTSGGTSITSMAYESVHAYLHYTHDADHRDPRPSALCLKTLPSLSRMDTADHRLAVGSYSPITSTRQNPLGPRIPTGPEVKKVPRRGVCGPLDHVSFSRFLNATEASCRSDPGPNSGRGSPCRDEMKKD